MPLGGSGSPRPAETIVIPGQQERYDQQGRPIGKYKRIAEYYAQHIAADGLCKTEDYPVYEIDRRYVPAHFYWDAEF